ncbi:12558_t:CDS:2 [Acaulospora colombiana]|uniref:12558_t:CDS:1 n=1 Tax=Acaulospora colombiana TaxID=27376 RepID=A0ACA9K2U6_9GLOM|nr:12558_t:CDS:2 [Acaulospora colombiana]
MEFFHNLSNDFDLLLDESDDYDVIIYAGKEPNVKKFYAHTVILRARSPYFRRALSRDWAKRENGSIVFQKPNITREYSALKIETFRYIYTGTTDLQSLDGRTVLNLLTASDELNLQELIAYSQDHLIQEKSEWLQENLIQALQIIANLEACKDLQDFCLGMICQDPYWLFDSEHFYTLEESIFVALLKRDDLLMEEIEIWNHLIMWGIAQNPHIDRDVDSWTLEDHESLRCTVEQCIPLIRYFHIDSADYYDKVRPFDRIFPDDLREDILQYYLKKGSVGQVNSVILPPRMRGIESNILKFRHAAIISKWIGRKEESPTNAQRSKYIFNLLLRGSRDGFSAQDFHRLCDNRGPTIVVMKVKESGEIIGGYNPLSWRKYRPLSSESWIAAAANRQMTSTLVGFTRPSYDVGPYQTSLDSFLFSFADGKNAKDGKLSRIIQEKSSFAVFSSSQHGPCFGQTDLRMNDNFNAPSKCTCQCSTYEAEISELQNFSVEEYEVFQVVDRDAPASPNQEDSMPPQRSENCNHFYHDDDNVYFHDFPTIFREQTFALGIPSYKRRSKTFCFDISEIGSINFNRKSNIIVYLKFSGREFQSSCIFKIDLKIPGKREHRFNNDRLRFEVEERDVVKFTSWSIRAEKIFRLLNVHN